jgi:hypothetical protein
MPCVTTISRARERDATEPHARFVWARDRLATVSVDQGEDADCVRVRGVFPRAGSMQSAFAYPGAVIPSVAGRR